MSATDPGVGIARLPSALSDPESQLDPHPWYREMREEGLRWDPDRGCWDVFRYDDVRQVLSDHGTFSSDTTGEAGNNPFESSMIRSDPPRHRRLRSVVDEFFQPDAVRELRPRVEELTDSMLSEAAGGDRIDVVEDLAYPLPVVVIAELLGVPPSSRHRFKAWSDNLVAGQEGTAGASTGAQREMAEYLMGMVARRREEPRDDLISRVVAAETDGEGLSEMEVLGFCMLLLVAGNITTTNLVTNAVWTLAEEDLLGAVRDGSVPLEPTVEEVLRYRSPVQAMSRVATADVTLAGRDVEAGEEVVAWIGSANRDGEAFDEPGAFRPERSPNRHVAFGHGIHYCLGAPLARLEAEVALSALLDRFDRLRVDATDLDPVESAIIYGVNSLPARVD